MYGLISRNVYVEKFVKLFDVYELIALLKRMKNEIIV